MEGKGRSKGNTAKGPPVLGIIMPSWVTGGEERKESKLKERGKTKKPQRRWVSSIPGKSR